MMIPWQEILCHERGETLAQVARQVVDAPSLEAFKAWLDGALSNLGHGEASLPIAGGLELGGHKGPIQPKPFCDFVICLSTGAQEAVIQNAQ